MMLARAAHGHMLIGSAQISHSSSCTTFKSCSFVRARCLMLRRSMNSSPCGRWLKVAASAAEPTTQEIAKPEEPTTEEVVELAPKPKLIPDEWQKVLELQGVVLPCVVQSINRGGAIVDFGPRTGFIPFSLLDARWALTPASSEEERLALIGSTVEAKIVEVNIPERRVMLSEKAANLAKLVRKVRVGDVVQGVVRYVADWGACVVLQDEECGSAEAMLHVSQLSWEWVSQPDQYVAPGQILRAKVIKVDTNATKIYLSLKQLQDDPLMETLDELLPVDGSVTVLTVPTQVPESVESLCEALLQLPAVTAVTLGRQAEEKRVVSQDLELWITKEIVADGYNLLARAGRVVQEVHVSSSMTRDEMKATITRLLRKIV